MRWLAALGGLGVLGASWRLLAPNVGSSGRSGRVGVPRGGRELSGRASPLLGVRGAQRTGDDARWATRAELRPLALRRPEVGRLPLGRAKRTLLAAERGSSVLVVGPTQSRKTSGFAIPAILEWEGPVVAASVKSDLARHSAAWRARQGRVWIYDPAESTGLGWSSWSPLAQAATWSGARRVARSLTEVARASASGLSDADFWYATAAKLLAPVLMAASASGRTMGDVVRWLDHQETADVAQALEEAAADDPFGSGGADAALQAARASWGREPRQLSAVYTTAETVVEAFADPVVAASAVAGVGGARVGAAVSGEWAVGGAAGTDGIIEPAALLEGPHTLYLCAPAHDQRRLRPLFATLVTQVLEEAYARAERLGAGLDPPLLVVLDEAANVAPLADLDVLASTAAGHGVQLVTVWQDLGQLHARYGTRAGSVINNHRAKIFLSGIADPQTLDHASALIGDAERTVVSRTFDGRERASMTESRVARRLLPADALRRVRPGHGVLVSGHLPPVRLSLRPWQADPVLRARAAGEDAASTPRWAWLRRGRSRERQRRRGPQRRR